MNIYVYKTNYNYVIQEGNMKKENAFTLAEVLITMAIIGVVAALTIPNLVQNYKKKVATVRLKKFVSSMHQAIALSELENGAITSWNVAASIPPTGDPNSDEYKDAYRQNANNALAFFNQYLAKYINYTKVEDAKDYKSLVYFADGSCMWLYNGSLIDIKYAINCNSGQDQNGIDNFAFLINYKTNDPYLGNRKFSGYYISPIDSLTREQAIADCKNNSYTCTALLEKFDNWEFKEDYPYKF